MTTAQDVHIFIASPCYGGIEAPYVNGLTQLMIECDRLGVHTTWAAPQGESHIDRCRNRLVNMMMRIEHKVPPTDLFFIDADIGFTTADVFSLVACERDVVGGLYPRKGINRGLVGRMKPGVTIEHDGCAEADTLGTGFMCIKRHVIERMRDEGVAKPYTTDYGEGEERVEHTYFRSGIINGRWMSEDYAFCRDLQSMGIKVYAHTVPQLTHSGTHIFRGDPRMLVIEPAEEPEGSAA